MFGDQSDRHPSPPPRIAAFFASFAVTFVRRALALRDRRFRPVAGFGWVATPMSRSCSLQSNQLALWCRPCQRRPATTVPAGRWVWGSERTQRDNMVMMARAGRGGGRTAARPGRASRGVGAGRGAAGCGAPRLGRWGGRAQAI